MNKVYDFLIDNENTTKTSFSIFVAILYLMILYIQIVSIYVMCRFQEIGTIQVAKWAILLELRFCNISKNMSYSYTELSEIYTDWYLGNKNDNCGRISKNLLQCISNFHLNGVQFLFENFIKKRGGAILNQEYDMNMPLQVCVFLSSVKNKINLNFPVLVICPENSLCKWHYHMTEVGFKPKIVSSQGIDPCEVYLLAFESVKLAEHFIDLDLFCVVIEEFDTIASKLIIRKVKGGFNIGLTQRNFYVHPDQKLRWTMLNWISPGCVGKLNDFYSIDRLHSLAFADNYRLWWLRLTWRFCDSFEPPTEEDLQDYHQTLNEWAKGHGIRSDFNSKETKLRKKSPIQIVRKVKESEELAPAASTSSSTNNAMKNGIKGKRKFDTSHEKLKPKRKKTVSHSSDEDDESETIKKKVVVPEIKSVDTIVRNQSDSDTEIDENVKSRNSNDIFSIFNSPQKLKGGIMESDDENPILSIINSQTLQENIKTDSSLSVDMKKLSQSSDSDSELLSGIIRNKASPSRFNRSQKISQLLDTLSDVEEKTVDSSDDNSFFSDLISGKKESVVSDPPKFRSVLKEPIVDRDTTTTSSEFLDELFSLD